MNHVYYDILITSSSCEMIALSNAVGLILFDVICKQLLIFFYLAVMNGSHSLSGFDFHHLQLLICCGV